SVNGAEGGSAVKQVSAERQRFSIRREDQLLDVLWRIEDMRLAIFYPPNLDSAPGDADGEELAVGSKVSSERVKLALERFQLLPGLGIAQLHLPRASLATAQRELLAVCRKGHEDEEVKVFSSQNTPLLQVPPGEGPLERRAFCRAGDDQSFSIRQESEPER